MNDNSKPVRKIVKWKVIEYTPWGEPKSTYYTKTHEEAISLAKVFNYVEIEEVYEGFE